jgi:hypothetical protein
MIGDDALDAALSLIADKASRLDVCAAKPMTYAAAMASIGYTGTFNVSKPSACPDGRKTLVTGIIDGTVTRKGSPTHWALTGQGKLLACGEIRNAPELTPGASFRLPDITIELMSGD